MFEIISKWNLIRPNEGMDDFISKITLRGYKGDSFLTGQFKLALYNEEIKALSVGDIASKICPTRRDLYFLKGVNKIKVKDKKTWGRRIGNIVENYFYNIYRNPSPIKSDYNQIKKLSDEINNIFFASCKKEIDELIELEQLLENTQEGDTSWLLSQLGRSAGIELASKTFNDSLLNKKKKLIYRILKAIRNNSSGNNLFIESDKILIQQDINPEPLEIGISTHSTPDFSIPEFGIVGDIKTGAHFNNNYGLTCAGYALAYENETKQPVNWGIIYFIPTRTHYKMGKALSFPQVHIFPIDESLRTYFLNTRDNAYDIISKAQPPNFPTDKKECPYCKFKDKCLSDGLILT